MTLVKDLTRLLHMRRHGGIIALGLVQFSEGFLSG
jgi:hypothetical protein